MGCCSNRGTASRARKFRRIKKTLDLKEIGYHEEDIAHELEISVGKIHGYLRDYELSKWLKSVVRRY